MSETPPPAGVNPTPRPRRRRDPESPRLGGMLAVIFWCACGITALPIAAMFSLVANAGVSGALWAISESFAGPDAAAQVLRLGIVPQLVLICWAASFVLLTVAKSRHALTFSPLLLAAWVAVSVYSQFAIRNAITPGGATLADFAALVPGLLVQAAGAAALVGYFKEGTRPKSYYVF